MPAADARESAVLELMRRRFDHVSAERVLSGQGLVNLYNTLAELAGVPAAPFTPAQSADASVGESDPLAREALAMFCAMLGTVAGDLALTLGARGGIYVPLSPGSVVAPSTAPTSAQPSGTPRCNNAGAPAGDESAARILSADNTASAADTAIAVAVPLDFRDRL